MVIQRAAIGRIVHYVSYGTPNGEYGRECRAAIITKVGGWRTVSDVKKTYQNGKTARTLTQEWDPDRMSLSVSNPTGQFYNEDVEFDPGDENRPDANMCDQCLHAGGTWHWPARIE